MSFFRAPILRKWCCGLAAASASLLLTLTLADVHAGHMIFNNNRAVGGVIINGEGVLENMEMTPELKRELNEVRAARIHAAPESLEAQVPIRKISLKELFAAVKEHNEKSVLALPQELQYLGGLQRIQYIFVYPEDNDIVLAGPAEGWHVGPNADVVGITTGRPVIHIDDLLVALRAAYGQKRDVITCSIDPRPEGVEKLRSFLAEKAKQREGLGPDANQTIRDIEHALGPQTITVTGVPTTSRFARTLVAADYRMKRLGMGFDPSPVKGMPSFMEMVRAPQVSDMMPRWWLAPDYEPVAVSEDGTAFEIRGQGVKAMTEDELVTDQGQRTGTGKVNPVAKKWADNFTANYTELSGKDPVFGSLRNCMDLAVMAALFVKHDLPNKANFDMSYVLDPNALEIETYNAPRTVPTQASAIKRGRNWIVSASGGVEVNGWEVVQKAEEKVPALAQAAEDAIAPAGASWVWN